MARISTIIPIYNRQESGERALASAVGQDVANHEIVLVDDASANPFQIPASLARNNIRLVRHSKNRGAAAARNTGIAAATGTWIALLDSDDYWLPDTLRPRLEIAERTYATAPSVPVAFVAGFVLENKRTGQQETRFPRSSDNPLHFASGCWFSPGSTLLLRKEAFDATGPYDSQIRRLEDLDWFLRFALKGGRLESWPAVAAIIETGSKIGTAMLEETASYLEDKYMAEGSPHRLPRPFVRRLKTYLDIERASIHAANSEWASTSYFIMRSWLRMPRATIHIERFWDSPPSR